MSAVTATGHTWVNLTKKTTKLRHRSLFLFNTDNKFRILLYRLSISRIFEYTILVAILCSCAILTIPNRPQTYDLSNEYTLADLLLNLVFTIEAAIKIVAHGFALHNDAYLRDPWNVFDFIVVVSGKLFFFQVL